MADLSKPYRRYPPDPPRLSRWLWLLVAALALALIANLAVHTL